MYKLRSGTSYKRSDSTLNSSSPVVELKQSTIEFRKRRRPTTRAAGKKEEDIVSKCSPPKRAKQETMPQTRSQSRDTSKSSLSKSTTKKKEVTRSPLKEKNTILTPSSSRGKEGDRATPTLLRTPESNRGTCAPRSVMKRLDFTEHSALNHVKKSLHHSLPSSLLCRNEQLTTLTTHIRTHLSQSCPGAIYISGAPGTGKTACLTHILNDMANTDLFEKTKVVTVNCMSVKRPQEIYSKMASELLGRDGSRLRSMQALQDGLMSHITSATNMILIVLDEIDQLDSRGQEILYTIFEWPSLKSSKLLLIGIANALDLTDRILPRLQSHVKCRPRLIHFPPYTKDEIATILSDRLKSENTQEGGVAIIDRMAIQFAARKVAAVHGDLRKALDICRRAVELVETEERCKSQHPTTTPSQHPTITPSQPPNRPLKVTLKHIAAVVSEVYSSSISSQAAQQCLPIQQKITLCVLLCMQKRRCKEVTLGKLHDAYVRVCRGRQLKYEGESEFVGVCSMLETLGIVGLKKAKETRLIKVTLKLNEAELEHAIQDKVLLSSILEQDVPSH